MKDSIAIKLLLQGNLRLGAPKPIEIKEEEPRTYPHVIEFMKEIYEIWIEEAGHPPPYILLGTEDMIELKTFNRWNPYQGRGLVWRGVPIAPLL